MTKRRIVSVHWLKRNTAYLIDPLLKRSVVTEIPLDPHRFQGNSRTNGEEYFDNRYNRSVERAYPPRGKP